MDNVLIEYMWFPEIVGYIIIPGIYCVIQISRSKNVDNLQNTNHQSFSLGFRFSKRSFQNNLLILIGAIICQIGYWKLTPLPKCLQA